MASASTSTPNWLEMCLKRRLHCRTSTLVLQCHSTEASSTPSLRCVRVRRHRQTPLCPLPDSVLHRNHIAEFSTPCLREGHSSVNPQDQAILVRSTPSAGTAWMTRPRANSRRWTKSARSLGSGSREVVKARRHPHFTHLLPSATTTACLMSLI